MDTLRSLVDTKELKTDLWNEWVLRSKFVYNYYNPRVDSFTLLIVFPDREKIVHYLDDYVALVYDPETMEVIGLRVEAFEKGFLPKYAELQRSWRLSDVCDELEDFGDLVFQVQRREKQLAHTISQIATPIAEGLGLEMAVPA